MQSDLAKPIAMPRLHSPPPIGGIPGTGVTSIKAKIGNSRLLWPGPLLANLLICAHEGETSNGLIKVTIQTPLSGCV